MTHPFRRSAVALAAGAALLAGSGAAVAHTGHEAKTQSVTLRFRAVAGTTAVSCGTPIAGLGTTNATAQLQDLRFYVSNVKMLRRNGTSVGVKLARNNAYNLTSGGNRTTLIDLENGTGACATDGTPGMNAVVTGTVPAGTYTGVQYYVGVPFTLNHSDTTTAKAPINIEAMAWSWQSGRKFMKVELADPGGATGTWKAHQFYVHLGSTGCVGNPATGATVNCKASNRAGVMLMKFNPATQVIGVDLRALVAANDITVNAAGAPGCMSGGVDPECGGVFGALGLDWKADGSGTGASMNQGMEQSVFRAMAR